MMKDVSFLQPAYPFRQDIDLSGQLLSKLLLGLDMLLVADQRSTRQNLNKAQESHSI
jgi:hypothetical protein